MIVPMKKLFLIVQKKDIESSLQKLADLGTVHIENCQAPAMVIMLIRPMNR